MKRVCNRVEEIKDAYDHPRTNGSYLDTSLPTTMIQYFHKHTGDQVPYLPSIPIVSLNKFRTIKRRSTNTKQFFYFNILKLILTSAGHDVHTHTHTRTHTHTHTHTHA